MNSLKNLLKTHPGLNVGDPLVLLMIIIIAMLLGLMLRYVYQIYYRKNEPVDPSIPRSFPIMAPAVASVFWLIQYSLPLSLGLLGALSFVRFRTPVKRAEDIAFILVLIACALACAVQQFMVAFLLILLVSVFGFIRSAFPQVLGDIKQYAVVTFHSSQSVDVDHVQQTLLNIESGINLLSTSTHDGITSIVINVPEASKHLHNGVLPALKSIDAQARTEIFYPNRHLGGY